MARYSIEILDGERRGELLPITERRFTIGRKSGNSLVLNDEKVSGVHAEIVAETGTVVLRDLGSTNGTRIENRKIDEVPLSAGDVIQIGLTRLKLVPENGPIEAGSDVAQVHRVDANAMARMRRKRVGVPLLLFVALVVAGGGYAYWRFVLSEDAPVRAGGKAPLVVADNLLPAAAANLEGESGFEPLPGGAAFAASSRAHTGHSALEAELTQEVAFFAAARLKDAITVAPGQPVTLRAQVCGDPNASGGARLLFLSSTDNARTLVAGGPLRKLQAKYEAFETQIATPPWADRASVVLLAAGEGKVFVDDVALLRGGNASENAVVINSRRFAEGGGWVYADAANAPILRAVKPSLPPAAAAGNPVLAGLAASGFLVFADLAPARPKIENVEDRARVQFEANPALSLVLVVPAASLSSGRISVQQGDGRFQFFGDRFEENGARGVMVGDGLGQVLVTVPEAGKIQSVPQGENVAISLQCPGGSVDFQTDFGQELLKMRNDLRLARDAFAAKKLGESLKHYGEAIHQHPFVPDELEKAVTERSRILDGLRAEIEALDHQIASADFFKTLGGYREALHAAKELAKRFEGAEGPQMTGLQSRQESLGEKLAELQRRENERTAEALSAVGAVLDADQRRELAELVKGYVERHFKGK